MNTGQMMLVIGAFAMLATLALSINGTITSSLSLSAQAEMAINAHAIAQSMLDEVLTKSFDEKVTGGKKVFKYEDMTPYGSFGTNFNEGITLVNGYDVSNQSTVKFDDIDDYHKYQRLVTNTLGWQFVVIDSIDYVNEDNPDQRSSTQTFFKKVTVHVYNDFLYRDQDGVAVPIVMKDFAVYRRYF